MNLIKYFIQFLIIIILFIIFRILGLKIASYISSKILILIGPFFRSKKIIETNILRAIPNLDNKKSVFGGEDAMSTYSGINS